METHVSSAYCIRADNGSVLFLAMIHDDTLVLAGGRPLLQVTYHRFCFDQNAVDRNVLHLGL